jgi:hypothetical protein
MTTHDFYVSPSEFLAGVEQAFLRAYLDDDKNLLDKRNWHPEDLAMNFRVIIDSIGAYSYTLILERLIEMYASQTAQNEELDIPEVEKPKKLKGKKGKK